MKTLAQLKKDPRVYEIIKQDLNECDHKYCINLIDGWTVDGYSGIEFADTVQELNEIVSGLILRKEG